VLLQSTRTATTEELQSRTSCDPYHIWYIGDPQGSPFLCLLINSQKGYGWQPSTKTYSNSSTS
jgi:hypothetical protein